LKVTVDKLRYGPKPRGPFILRRDDFTFMHSLWLGTNVEVSDIAKALYEEGGGLSFSKMRDMACNKFSISDRQARRLINDAVNDGWINTMPGKRNALIHDPGKKYLAARGIGC